MKKLEYVGKEGITCQYGTYLKGWTGEVADPVAEALLKVPGFKEVKETEVKETEVKEVKKGGK